MGIKHGDIKASKGVFSVTLLIGDKAVQLDSEDVIDMYFIEDIFKYCITGKLVFYDKYNFLELGPFTGNEQIIITYGVDTDTTLIFDIWNVSEISMTLSLDSQSFGMIELFFIDPTFQTLSFRKYSRSWGETPSLKMSKIMVDILENMTTLPTETALQYEESSNYMNGVFIMPYWSPRQAIDYLTSRAVGSTSQTSGYLCYNNTQNNRMTTNLFSLNYLLNDDGKFADEDIYIFSGRDISNVNKILEWTITGTDKASHEFLRGGKFRGYDWETKSLLESEKVYSDGASDMVMLGKKTLFPDISDPYSTAMNLGEKDIETIDNIFFTEWSQRYVLQNLINVTLYGHEKRFAGQLIEIQWPSSIEVGGSFLGFNLSYKGTYLIKSITHSFVGDRRQQETYLQKAVLIKNAYSEVDDDLLYGSSKVKNRVSTKTIIRN